MDRQNLRTVLILLFLAAWTGPLGALDFGVRTGPLVPAGDSARWFEAGTGLGADWVFPLGVTPLRLWAGLDAFHLPHKARGQLLTLQVHPGLGVDLLSAGGLTWGAALEAGWALAVRSDFTAWDHRPWTGAAATLRWKMEPTLTFRAALQYQTAWTLYQGVCAWVGFDLTEVP